MKTNEEILEYLETPEGRKKANDLAREYINKINDEDKKRKDIVSNTDYLNWLISFMQDKDTFFDDDWSYSPLEIKDNDKKNVDNLYLFYEGIEDYAAKNYIYPAFLNYGSFYKIRLYNLGFEVGMISGQGTSFFCKKVIVNDENIEDFIDFNDIMTNKKQESVDVITDELSRVRNSIMLAYEKGIPAPAIIDTLEDTTKEIVSKGNNVKKRIRKI